MAYTNIVTANSRKVIPILDPTSKLMDIGNLPVVGTMGNAIIESGSNSNGNYVKFADGTLICYRYKYSSTPSASNTPYSLLWTFPATFIDTNSAVIVIGDGSNPQNECFSANDIRTNYAQIKCYKATTTEIYLRLIAIGRWKA